MCFAYTPKREEQFQPHLVHMSRSKVRHPQGVEVEDVTLKPEAETNDIRVE